MKGVDIALPSNRKLEQIKKMKHIKYYCVLVMFAFTALISACNHDDPETFGKEFCDCLKEHGSPGNYVSAMKACEAQFRKTNRMYKLYRVDMFYYESNKKVSEKTKDSVYKYMRAFDDYTISHCCNLMGDCNIDSMRKADSKKLKNMDR